MAARENARGRLLVSGLSEQRGHVAFWQDDAPSREGARMSVRTVSRAVRA